MASTSHTYSAPTLPIILLVEQREDLDVPPPQVLHVVPQALLAVLHRREGHERLAAGPLQAVLSDHHRRLAQSVARQLQRREEGGDVLLGRLCVRRQRDAHGIGQSAELEREDVVLLDAVCEHGFLLIVRLH